jgi:hypothetical protein
MSVANLVKRIYSIQSAAGDNEYTNRQAYQLAELAGRLAMEAERLQTDYDALFEQTAKLKDLVAKMWDQAKDWSGPTASSHIRSDISSAMRELEVDPYPRPK